MDIDINRDPEKLNKSFFGGKKWWQYMCIVAAFVISIFFTLIFGGKIDSSVNGIICSVVVVPLGYVGLFSKNGLDFFEYYKARKNFTSGKNAYYDHNPPVTVQRKRTDSKIVAKKRGGKK